MKTYLSTTMYLLLLFSFSNSFSQIGITTKDYEVTSDVVKIQEFHFKEIKDVSISNLFYLDTHEFESGYITSKIRIIEDVQHYQQYRYNASKNEFSFEESNAIHGDFKREYQLITFNHLKFYYPKTDFVVIQNKPNLLFEFSYTIEGRKITRKLEKLEDNYITDTYDDYGYHIDTYNTIGQKVTTETRSLSKSDLLYNTDGLIEESKTIHGKYVDRIHHTYYSYEKDEKGNWIKRVEITISPDNEIKTTFTSRILTYANGDVTGDGNYDSTFVMWELVIYSPDLKEDSNKSTSATSNTIPDGLVWSKNDTNTNYVIYNNGSKISGEGTTFWVGNDFYVYLTLINEIYLLKDFKTLNAFTYYRAELLPFKPTNGVWYKRSETEFIIINAHGKPIKEFEIDRNIQNGIDLVGNEKGQEKTLLLKNANNAILNTVYKVEVITSDEANTKTTIASSAIPSGLVWKKNSENTEVWLYENGIELDGSVFFVDNTLYFYDTKNDHIYKLDNFNAQTANSYHNATQLPHKYPHGAWMRWDAQGGLQAVNAKGEIIRDNTIFKNAANNIDVIYKGKGETETLFFKGFHNAKIKEVLPAEIYNPTSVSTTTSNVSNSSTSSTSSFQTEIDACNGSGKCLAKKVTDKYTSLKNSGIAEDVIYAQLAENFNAIGAYKTETLYKMILSIDLTILPKEKYSKIMAKMSPEQRANLKAHAQKIIDDYRKTHN